MPAARRVGAIGGRGDGADAVVIGGVLVGEGDEALDLVSDVGGVAIEHPNVEGADPALVDAGDPLLEPPRLDAESSSEAEVLLLECVSAPIQRLATFAPEGALFRAE